MKKMVQPYSLKPLCNLTEACKQGQDLELELHYADWWEIIMLQYTGGTTGVSKGAMLSHRNLVSNILQTNMWVEHYLDEDNKVALCPLPLYHIFAFTVNMLQYMSLGWKTIIVSNPRDIN